MSLFYAMGFFSFGLGIGLFLGAIFQAKHDKSLMIVKLPAGKNHLHLDHITRDEDQDGGWCDTCQDTFEGSTLYTAGYNSALNDTKNLNNQ